ncbi:hypothetical protein Syun_005687 [Stephania yunnanensis]|uniref:Uncharacterized protein n=1 Tax=Stephania yunnanensis TaxID=152371 RepID=A0AAP0Q2H8_9MAGN
MKLVHLFFAATFPVLKVIIVTAVGSVLALNRFGILGNDSKKHLNNVTFYVFNPALISTYLAKTLTSKTIATLWFMPLNILLASIMGSILAWLVIQITKPPQRLRALVLGCCSAGNLGNIFLIIIPAICKEKGSPFGAPEVCNAYGMAYASLSLAIGSIYLWSYVYNVMRVSSNKSIQGNQQKLPIDNPNKEADGLPSKSCIEAPLPPKEGFRSEENAGQLALPYSKPGEDVKVSWLLKFKKALKLPSRNSLKKLFTPSTIGAIVGLFIGVVPQIRWLLIGDSAPLRVVEDSFFLLGQGAIPCVSLVLGVNLTKGLKGAGVQASVIVGIVLVRYVLLPLFGILVVKGASHIGLIHSEPLYRFVLLLQYAVPPAMNIGTITQLFGVAENECSIIMLWTYALASVSLTLWSILFMWLVS